MEEWHKFISESTNRIKRMTGWIAFPHPDALSDPRMQTTAIRSECVCVHFRNQVRKMKKALGVIPARLGSSRFPGKPLAEFFGKTMIEHTYTAATASKLLDKVVVASDSEQILRVIEQVGGDTMITGECATGTDRIVQALHRMDPAELREYDIVVNIQGDEPGVNPKHIDLCVAALRRQSTSSSVMSTLATPILDERDAVSRDVVKCVADHQG